ncbi:MULTISPECIES: MlaE family ABC transporter permease [unclassified Nocardia]|uniref:MlaE family ABC transporter permease n=1 Tax=unclassified Nocardia TaxID=2637762 RepID=UPI0033B7FB16
MTIPREAAVRDSPQGEARLAQTKPATREISAWWRGYLRRHPVAALETVGGQFVLGVRAVQYLVADIATGRFAFGEFIRQSAFMSSAAVLPTIFVSLPIGVTLSIQFGLLAGQVGATSLAGAASGLAVIRQGAPMVAALLMASAVGSAICADLGSRKIRDELDAMEVMGVSVVRRLVVPRVAAAVLVGVSLTGVVCFVGFLAGYLFNVFAQNGAPGSFVATFASFATVGDLWLTLVKAVVYGMIVAVVACEKGLHTEGGPAGVANAVNSTVVSSILLLMLVNVVFTQLFMILFPRQGL